MEPALTASQGDPELIEEVWQAYDLTERGEAVHDKLREILAKRTNWCDCAPGLCDGLEQRGCRQNSPLVTR